MSRSWVYILKGSNDYYYVGTTNRLLRRLKEHVNGNGAKVTKNFCYNILVGLYKVGNIDDLESGERENLENVITLQLMKLQQNPKKVRGGLWTTHGVEDKTWEFSKQLIEKLKKQKMPVICGCGVPALKTENKYVCSISHNIWINKNLPEGICINYECDYEESLEAELEKEPNYCFICNIPCGSSDSCFEHKNKIKLNSLESFGINIKNIF